jgi:hypothetical protein
MSLADGLNLAAGMGGAGIADEPASTTPEPGQTTRCFLYGG